VECRSSGATHKRSRKAEVQTGRSERDVWLVVGGACNFSLQMDMFDSLFLNQQVYHESKEKRWEMSAQGELPDLLTS
jgi:hypothetical protein